MNGPNAISVGWSLVKALRTRKPNPSDTAEEPDHTGLQAVLASVKTDGVAGLPGLRTVLDEYLTGMARLDPDQLSRSAALAYWLNLYNAGALALAGDAFATDQGSVLRVPGAFTSRLVGVAGEQLSLSDIEHGKIRRFQDPRIHAALVCGSVSCPTLRFEPYRGSDLDAQLDSQTRSFLSSGGAVVEGDTLRLSRVFLWYGADFVRPRRMPTFLPARRRQVARALRPWLDPAVDAGRVAFEPYDWALACSVGSTE